MKKFQKNNLNKKDHEKVDKGAKAVKKITVAVGTVGMCVPAVVKFAPKIIKKVTKL